LPQLAAAHIPGSTPIWTYKYKRLNLRINNSVICGILAFVISQTGMLVAFQAKAVKIKNCLYA
jgi:hypothetical protein